MCTAITFQTKDHYFGRNLDLEYHYNEAVTITPRNFPLIFHNCDTIQSHFGLIGISTVVNHYPLYYDATNEKGLSMAGLNFPGNAVYLPKTEAQYNIAPFEFIPWILGQCANLKEALEILKKTNLSDIPFSKEYPLSPLHWILADKTGAVTIEPRTDGLHIYDNPVGVLTNNPPFDYHLQNLQNYLNLTRDEPQNRFSSKLNLHAFSRGMGAIGLPGDLSSQSRFIRGTFTKFNSVCLSDEKSSVSQFFHILGSVEQQCGCVKVGDGFEKTIYSSCCNADRGIYYYKTYDNSKLNAVAMHKENLDGDKLSTYPLIYAQEIEFINP